MKRESPWIRATLAGVAATAVLVTTACAAGEADSSGDTDALRVGLLFSLTGPAAPFGISERNGAKVVLDDINARGGINGRPVEYVEADDKSDPTEAAQQARALITQHRVDVIIGTTSGGNTMAFAPIAASSKVPVLATNGTIDVTSKDNDFWPWVFRAAPSDLITAKVMFDQVISEGHRKIAVFAEETGYGDSTLEYLEELIAAQDGAELATVARAAVADTDFSAQATKIRKADPDVVLLVTSIPTLGSGITRSLRQSGSEVALWGPIGLAQEAFITGAGSAAEGVHMVAMNDWNNPSEDEQQLAALLEAAGEKGTSYEVAGSNGAQAIEAAAATIEGEITGEKLRDALENVCGLDTYAIGEGVCYTEDDHDGYGEDSLTMLVVQDGAFTTYQP